METVAVLILVFIVVAGFIFILILETPVERKKKTITDTRDVQKGFIRLQMKDGTELKGPEVTGIMYGRDYYGNYCKYEIATNILKSRIESFNNLELL